MKIAHLLLLASLPLTACAASETPEEAAEEGESVPGASDSDITSGAAAKLLKVSYKKAVTSTDGTNSKCNYDISWLSVSSKSTISAAARTALNTALYYGPKTPDLACSDPGFEIEGGYSKVSVNASGVLSVEYNHASYSNGAAHPNTTSMTINLDVKTGKWITLGDILTDAGKKTLLESCKKQWQATITAEAQDIEQNGECEGATTLATGQKTESFTIEPTGLRIHIDNQLPHAFVALAGEGFLVKWADLGAGLKAGSVVKGLAKR
ncbi:MAG: hypothetical protein U0174_09135 [Polyangiaceae bacterium]